MRVTITANVTDVYKKTTNIPDELYNEYLEGNISVYDIADYMDIYDNSNLNDYTVKSVTVDPL